MINWWVQMWPQVFPNLIASLLWAPIAAGALWAYHRWVNKPHLARVEAATARMHEAAARLEKAVNVNLEKTEEEIVGRG